MPMPNEYQLAAQHFEAFLVDARDALGHTTRNQTYTTIEGVFRAFRRRLTHDDSIRFANALPALLRALYVADWDPEEQVVPFGERADWTVDVKSLRAGHNFAPESAVADLAAVLRRHVDPVRLESVLARLPAGARAFWATG